MSMRKLIFFVFLTLLMVFEPQAQAPPAQAPADTVQRNRADEWMKRLNALSDWRISLDGKEEGVDQRVDSMMELFASDVVAEVPPHDPDQIGLVMLRGSANVRKWVDEIARTQTRLTFDIARQTGGPTAEYEGWQLVFSTPMPWGGTAIAFQIRGTWSMRENRRRFTAPGAVFLEYGADGKIHRLRLFLAETAEVEPV
jgi:SnoaL-like domain